MDDSGAIRVLLIEDNPVDALLLEESLAGNPLADFQITVAERLSQGLEQTRQHSFDIALLDLGLPDSQGLETFRRFHQQVPHLPVVVLSGLADEQTAVQAVQAGAQDYLAKGEAGWNFAPRAIRYALERQQVQAMLQASERRFRALIENSADAFALVDINGNILYESPSVLRILGIAPENMVGRNAYEFLHPDDFSTNLALFQQLLEQPGQSQTGQVRYQHQDGTWRWLEVTLTNLLDEPAVQAIVVNYHDVTERKQAEETLKQSEKDYRGLFEGAHDAILVFKPEGELVLDVNQRACEIYGFSRDEFIGLSMETITKDVQLGKERIAATLVKDTYLHFETTQYRKDGTELLLEVNATLLDYQGEKVILSINRDITERKRAAEEIQTQRDFALQVMNTMGQGLSVLSKEGQFEYANPAYARMIGRTQAELQGITPMDVVFPEDRLLQEQARLDRLAGKITSYEVRLLHKDGTLRPVLITGTPRWQDGEVVGAISVITDLTEQKRAEETLRLQSASLQAAANAIVITNHLGNIVWINPAFSELTGYSLEEAVGRNPRELVKSGVQEKSFYKDMWDTIRAGKVWQGTLVNRRKDGSLYDDEMTITPLMNPQGDITHFIAIKQNVTERKQAEEALARQRENLFTLYMLGQEIGSTVDLDAIYTASHRAASRLMPGEIFVISLLNEAEQEIEDVYLWDKDRRWEGGRYPAGQDLPGYILSTCEPLRVNEWDESYDQMTGATNFGYEEETLRSVLAVPLFRAGGTCFGMISIQSYTAHAYPPEHEQLLITLANQVAKAIENAQLYIQVNLELAERKQAETNSQESRARLNNIIDSAMDAIVTIDKNQRIVLFNAAAEKMFRISAEEAIGQSLERFIPPDAREIHNHHVQAYSQYQITKRDALHPLEAVTGLRADGEEFPCDVSISQVETADGKLFTSILRDITERKQAEDEIRYQAYLLNQVSDAVVSLDMDFNIRSWNQGAEAIYDWKADEVIGKRGPDIVPTAFLDSQFEEAREHLMQKGWWQGNVEQIDRHGKHLFIQCSTTLLRNPANQPTGMVSVNRDTTEFIKHQREMTAIIQVSSALRSAATRAEMVPIVLDQLDVLFGAEATAFTSVDPVVGDIVVEMARGVLAETLRDRLPRGEGVSGHVMTTQQAYLNNDAISESMIPGASQLGDHHAIACVPMIAHHQTIGALWLARKQAITPNDLKVMTAVADIAGSAIHRSRLFEQTQQQLERLAILHAMDTAIASSFDLRPTLYILLDQIHTRLKVAAADVFLFNSHTLTLEFAAGNGFRSQGMKHTRLHLGEGCTGQTALEHRIVAIPDFQKYLIEHPSPAHRLLQAEIFVSYYGIPLMSKGQIKGVLELFHRTPFTPDEKWEDFLDTLGRQVAIAIDNVALFEDMQRSKLELELAYDATIEGWSRALDLRDKETEGHSFRVTELTIRLARGMGFSETDIVHIRRGALLHDIGKMGVPDSILLKPGKLTEEEWVIMKKHPQLAYEMLSPIPYLKAALDIPHSHHEKWDGTGYPHGLKGEQIPLAARIFAIADVWDALTSNRPYREAWPPEKAYTYIREQSGTHFDPKVVEAFLSQQDFYHPL